MIVGIGVDVVDIARFTRTLERTPALRERLFAPSERARPDGASGPRRPESLAGCFAAKEALAKALGAPVGMAWHDAVVVREAAGEGLTGAPPRFELTGSVAERAAERGVARVHLSISHDGGVATAFVVLEGDGVLGRTPGRG